MRLAQFDTVFFDFDGVICDSNMLKRDNIRRACISCDVSAQKSEEFVSYFTSLNGVPRERKTRLFFKDDELSDRILKAYSENNTNLLEAPLLPGLVPFLKKTTNKRCIVLSGGNLKEITNFLKKHGLITFFEQILCGPSSKEENLNQLGNYGSAFFIGDSSHDYEVARSFNLPFVFMFAATQMTDWKSREFVNTIVTKDFETLMTQSQNSFQYHQRENGLNVNNR